MGNILRRTFLVGLGAVAGGLAVGYYTLSQDHENPLDAQKTAGEAVFNPWVYLDTSGQFNVIVPRAEMGQGVTTTLAALAAEELGLPLDALVVEHGPAAGAYYNAAMLEEGGPFPVFADSFFAETMRTVSGFFGKTLGLQVTGGSSSTRDAFDKMRYAGAAARHVVLSAAAAASGQDMQSLTMSVDGVRQSDGSLIPFADLLDNATAQTVPENLKLKEPSEWTLLGKPQQRTDVRAKVTGAPIYGVDVDLPDMVYGTVRMSPVFGGKPRTADLTAAEAMAGVIKIVPLNTQTGHGFGVIAQNSWAAFKAAEAIAVEWDAPAYPATSEEMMDIARQAAAGNDGGSALRNDGDTAKAIADAAPETILEADYDVPFLAHATMEPMNATAQFADGKLEIWAPNQAPTIIRTVCAGALEIDSADVSVNTTFLGGGFGRRGEVDFALYASLLAKETEGRPIKVIWTREEDTTHDTYRPLAAGRFKAVITQDGKLTALDMRIATPSILESVMGRTFPSLSPAGPERLLTEGAFDQPYSIANYRVSGHKIDNSVPVGFWRAVGNSFNGFFHECFMDEIAQKAGRDPFDLRVELMADFPVAVSVMQELRSVSQWDAPLPANKAKGVAFTLSFGSWVGQVVQVANTPDGVRIEKVWIVADVGTALDPAIIENQLTSGAIFGLSSALGQEITITDGMVDQQNFYDFDAMRMNQVPDFEVVILENSPHMGGVGEIGTPPSIPALANAVSKLSGNRLRQMPLSKEIAFA
ncbi:MAG: molybdopterin cofactor-binding domain-containing protein [Ahrensia sp.]